MKGIILAGGSGTRLYPLTQIMSKQLLPVYDKPMICYPLGMLMLLGISDILIISTKEDTPRIETYLKDGAHLGIKLSYKVQEEPRGIADAFIIGKEFIGNDDVCLILGDNIFYPGDQVAAIRERFQSNPGALVFAYHVNDPERFGVIEFQKGADNVVSIEEKPKNPKSRYAAVGLYAYKNDVVAKAEKLKPSARGELEITDLNNLYLQEGRLEGIKFRRGTAWLDAGTPQALLDASAYIGAIEARQGLKISCLEEIAFRLGYIDETQLRKLAEAIKPGADYRRYLETVLVDP